MQISRGKGREVLKVACHAIIPVFAKAQQFSVAVVLSSIVDKVPDETGDGWARARYRPALALSATP